MVVVFTFIAAGEKPGRNRSYTLVGETIRIRVKTNPATNSWSAVSHGERMSNMYNAVSVGEEVWTVNPVLRRPYALAELLSAAAAIVSMLDNIPKEEIALTPA